MYTKAKTRKNTINRRNVSQAKYAAIEREERRRRERNNSRYLNHFTALCRGIMCKGIVHCAAGGCAAAANRKEDCFGRLH